MFVKVYIGKIYSGLLAPVNHDHYYALWLFKQAIMLFLLVDLVFYN